MAADLEGDEVLAGQAEPFVRCQLTSLPSPACRFMIAATFSRAYKLLLTVPQRVTRIGADTPARRPTYSSTGIVGASPRKSAM